MAGETSAEGRANWWVTRNQPPYRGPAKLDCIQRLVIHPDLANVSHYSPESRQRSAIRARPGLPLLPLDFPLQHMVSWPGSVCPTSVLSLPKSPSTHFSTIYSPHATNIHKINLQTFVSKQTSVSAAENNWMRLCKLFLFGNPLCLFSLPLSGLFIISRLEIQKSVAQRRSESPLPDWLCFTEWFLGVETEPRSDIMHTSSAFSSKFLTKQKLNDFHENSAAMYWARDKQRQNKVLFMLLEAVPSASKSLI